MRNWISATTEHHMSLMRMFAETAWYRCIREGIGKRSGGRNDSMGGYNRRIT